MLHTVPLPRTTCHPVFPFDYEAAATSTTIERRKGTVVFFRQLCQNWTGTRRRQAGLWHFL